MNVREIVAEWLIGSKEAVMFDHVWYWRVRLSDRKGQLCRVLARGKMNNILVEFEDGYRVVTARYAVRRR